MWSLMASPTVQMKAGPIVGFSAWNFAYVKMVPNEDFADPWFFEPYRGMVLGREDVVYEHTSALLYQALSGEGEPLLRIGALARGTWSSETPDRSLQLGVGAQFKPDTKPGTPTLLVVVAPYLVDPDFLGPIPFFALVATWEGEPRK